MMITANELRKGNWIYIDNGEKPKYAYQVSGHDIDEVETDGSDCFGVPLHPEILEKCGFVKNRNGEPSIEINDIASHLELMGGKDNFYYPSFTQTPQGDEERSVYFNRINSLHQLQNLYFSLTGQELTITL